MARRQGKGTDMKSCRNYVCTIKNLDTPLNIACHGGHVEVVEALLRHGASHTCENKVLLVWMLEMDAIFHA